MLINHDEGRVRLRPLHREPPFLTCVLLSSILIYVCSQPRAVPSPAFNQEPRRNEVHPLQDTAVPEMDESFKGLSGGAIFHEMMLRQGVKHVFGYRKWTDFDLPCRNSDTSSN